METCPVAELPAAFCNGESGGAPMETCPGAELPAALCDGKSGGALMEALSGCEVTEVPSSPPK